MTRPSSEAADFVAIGVGPANLSLAALAHPVADLRGRLLDGKPHFQWHPGIMLPSSRLQVSYLKDLVTLVDPTSRFSFLNFLADTGRIYRSLLANGMSCSRQEFEEYYRWACDQLPAVEWHQQVKEVRLIDGGFEIHCENGTRATAVSIVLGSGREPALPDFAAALQGEVVLHSSALLSVQPQVQGRRVLVVGGGQSGAEVIDHLLSADHLLPSTLSWVSSRVGFQPLDDSAFTNEWFAPNYVDYFYRLPEARRTALLRDQRFASDGISEELLSRIYQRLYQLDTTGAPLQHHLLPNRRVVDLHRLHGGGLLASIDDLDLGRVEHHEADVVIFCTGYRSGLPDYLEPIRDRIADSTGGFSVRADYSLEWNGPNSARIFLQNGAERSHGIADPNLSLMSWRSARILNALAGRPVYRIDHASATIDWGGLCPPAREPRSTTDLRVASW